MIQIQYEFFEDKEEIRLRAIEEHGNKVGNSLDKVRKALWARNNELEKKQADLENRLQILEQNICKGIV
jgi:hypothetical protein